MTIWPQGFEWFMSMLDKVSLTSILDFLGFHWLFIAIANSEWNVPVEIYQLVLGHSSGGSMSNQRSKQNTDDSLINLTSKKGVNNNEYAKLVTKTSFRTMKT